MSNIENNQDQQDDFSGIFNLGVEDTNAHAEEGANNSDPDFYRPAVSHPKAKDATYKAFGRYVPNVNDKSLQEVFKYVYVLPDLKSTRENAKFYVDCPEVLGKRNNILSTAFFMLKDSDSGRLRKIAKDNFSRKRYWFRLFQIIRDEQEPELAYKIRINRYGIKIKEKMDFQQSEDKSIGKTSCQFIDPFEGKNFSLVIDEVFVQEQNRKQTSYEKSSFLDTKSVIQIEENGAAIPKTKEGMQMIFSYLKANSPDLSKASPVMWDEELEAKIIETVRVLVEDDETFNKIYKKAYGREYFGGATTTAKKEESKTVTVPEMTFNASEKKTEVKTENKTETGKKEESKVENPIATKIEESQTTDLTNIEINFDNID